MENKTITLKFVKNGQPFNLPTKITPGFYKKLLEINAEAEKKYQHLQGTQQYENLVAMKSNIDTAYYILHNIDPNITIEDVENWDDPDISLGEFILELYNIENINNEKTSKKKQKNKTVVKNSTSSTGNEHK